MIVKNESHIIESTLEMLSKYIDYWVICDTGSTDNTIQIIKDFFKKKNIDGELYEDKWEDFGTNRTKALVRAYNKCDYIWVFDADDLIVGDIIFPETTDVDQYYIKFGKEFTYVRGQVFKSSLKWVYRGVLHEYPECQNKKNLITRSLEGNYYVESRRLGDRNKNNPDKYLKDAETLIRGLDKDIDLRSRYYFYIGRSFFDYNDYEKAIYWYKKRVEEGGWIEEVFYSNLQIGLCMERLGYDDDMVTKQYLLAHYNIQDRIEPLFSLGVYFATKYRNFKKVLEEDNNNDEYDIKSKTLNSYLERSKKYFEMGQYMKVNNKYGLFVYSDIYEWKNNYELSRIYLESGEYEKANKLCKDLLTNMNLRQNLDIFNYIEGIRLNSIKYDETILTTYPAEKIKEINERIKKNSENKNNEVKVTLTITTCKRYDLFSKTINSFITNCIDIDMIDRWICIDDNSSDEDRENMLWNYPFFEFVFKDIKSKGHSVSMNIIMNMVKSPYWLHLEDDWLFIEKTWYIKPALCILESSKFKFYDDEGKKLIDDGYKIKQVLFNRNYTETLDKNVIAGGYIAETLQPKLKFVIQEHISKNPNRLTYRPNCAYWPHYSFRPSIVSTDIFSLGAYSNDGFFERAFADKYYASKYISVFYDKITCIHLGKKTWEREGLNAYELNGVDQFKFVKKNKYLHLFDKYKFFENMDSFGNDLFYFSKPIDELAFICDENEDALCFNSYGFIKSKVENNFVNLHNQYNDPDGLFVHIDKFNLEVQIVNLKRREDRKEQMIKMCKEQNLRFNIFEAVDGKDLIKNPPADIINLFKNNDFGSRCGFIGCALSHKKLWEQLLNENIKDYYIILEDDIEVNIKFKKHLKYIQKTIKSKRFEDWDIIFLAYSTYNENFYKIQNQKQEFDINLIDFDKQQYVGGTFSYIISKSGARKLLKYIEENGIKHGIDYMMIKKTDNLNIFQLDKFITNTEWVKTDSSQVDTDIQKNFEYVDIYSDENFIYFRGMDSCSNDHSYDTSRNIEVMKKKSMENPDILGFNTLGFYKLKIKNKLEPSPYYKNLVDGIYIKKSYFENKKLEKNTFARIKLICNWNSPQGLCNEWNHMTQGNHIWNNFKFVADDDADYFVIINKPLRVDEYYDPLRTIIFHMEPWCYESYQNWGVKTWNNWAKPNPFSFLQVRTHNKYINNCMWQLSLTWKQLKTEPIIKNDDLSTTLSSICSSKYYDPGHIKRIDFLHFIENKLYQENNNNAPPFKLDIYNNDNMHSFKSYRGKATQNVDKDKGIVPYKYYFMCENNIEHNFITEKIWEPIITETLVFYWGCPNLSDYIDPMAVVLLDMNDFEKSYNIICDAIKNNLWEERIGIIRKEKQKILDYYNFFPTIERVLERDYQITKEECLMIEQDNLKHNYLVVVKKLLYEYTQRTLKDIESIKTICMIHSCNLELNGLKKLNEILDFLIQNNTINKFDMIIINNIGIEIGEEYEYSKLPNVYIQNYSSETNNFEIDTLKILSLFSKYLISNTKILYMHTKGISYDLNDITNSVINDWTNLMLNFLASQYTFDYCIHLLDTQTDNVGINYIQTDFYGNNRPHWGGNFWWSKSFHIKNLSVLNLKTKEDAEWFILSNNNLNRIELYNSYINHYLENFGLDKYKNKLLEIKNEYESIIMSKYDINKTFKEKDESNEVKLQYDIEL